MELQPNVASTDSDPLGKLRQAAANQNWKVAAKFADTVLISHGDNADIVAEIARVKALSGDEHSAALLAVEAAKLDGMQSQQRVEFAVKALVQVGEFYLAMDLMEQFLKTHPQASSIRRTLVGFLGEAERYDLIPEHLQRLIIDRDFDAPLLVVTTEHSARRFSRDNAKKIASRNPNDLRILLASCRQKMVEGDFSSAESLLRKIIARHQTFAPAYAMLGQSLIANGSNRQELTEWYENVPTETREFADYWLTLADVALESGDVSVGARSYWEATRREPNNIKAWSGLIRSLELLEATVREPLVSDTEIKDMRFRIAKLLELRRRFYDFTGGGRQEQRHAALVAKSLLQLGRYWEAEAWSAIAATLTKEPYESLNSLREKILRRLDAEREWIAPKHCPALLADLSDVPLPDEFMTNREKVETRILRPTVESHSHIKFVQEGESRGLKAVGANNNPLGVYLSVVRTTGVGAGVIDVELDGWPDLIVMAAGGSVTHPDSQPNLLMRNLDGQFVDVTPSAAILDKGYGQGVVVGDFNEDGFSDLLFANLGLNRLFRNNGDGTFTDCTDRLDANDPLQWSTSGAFADLNGDGLSDLVVSNYCDLTKSLGKTDRSLDVQGDSRAESDSRSGDEKLAFHPLEFPSQADIVMYANGDGTFRDQAQLWMQQTSFGRGLGVVCGQFSDGFFGLLIANDMSSNNFYQWPLQAGMVTTPDDVADAPDGVSTESSGMPVPPDSAFARGLAVNGQSLTQASMGIAQCDFDGDGDLDFYVTGFAREHNILYEQIAPGLWQDRTHLEKLIKPTHMMVAFGSDAIDIDNDGIEEIVVTNGGIGDQRQSPSVPYQQPLQIFRRDGSGAFTEVRDDFWGEYFASDHVGRTLVQADFDRDGGIDSLVTHNYEPVALLMNRTNTQNHWVRFRLIGTNSSRDSVGAIVRFIVGGRQRALWSVAGDGYLCSNERFLHAGLGGYSTIENVSVTWRDGTVEQFGSLPADATHLLIQGKVRAFALD
jgi:tetratricopeptide (TPR) repeat protein